MKTKILKNVFVLKTRSVSQSAFSNLHALAGLVVFAAFAASGLPDSSSAVTFNNVIVNGGFEVVGELPWFEDASNPPAVVSSAQHHSGTTSALLGTVSGPEPLGDCEIYQQITVPAVGCILSYWWWGGTTDTITFDWQDAHVTDSVNNILATISH